VQRDLEKEFHDQDPCQKGVRELSLGDDLGRFRRGDRPIGGAGAGADGLA